MKINRIIICLFVMLALGSCQLSSFSSRPGVVVKSYPKEMYGTYRSIEKHKGVKDTHYIVINEKGASMDDPTTNKIINLSDTNNTLSQLGDFYYLNLRDTDSAGNQYFYIYPFEFDEKNLYVYTLSLGKTQKKLGKYLKPAGSRTGNFTMDNQAFLKYCEKNLKKRKALKLKRIK